MSTSTNPVGDTALTAEQIAQSASLVAQKLNQEFANQKIVVITVVPGGILLTADMVLKFTIDVSMDYISCPYPWGTRKSF